MVKRAGSFRARTRKKLRKVPRTRGKVTITRMLQGFKAGEQVVIKQEPAIHAGMPHPRFKGIGGTVVGKQGTAYKIRIRDKNATKTLIAAPVHLLRAKP